MTKQLNPFNPFNLSEQDIRQMAGEMTAEEMRTVKAVLNGIKAKLHDVNMQNGFTHSDGCWSWGPAHYLCAYNRIIELGRSRAGMTTEDVHVLADKLNIPFIDAVPVVRAVEKFHLIGDTR